MNGEVARKLDDKGYGFIKAEDGNEYFFHRTKCVGQCSFDKLREGDRVCFEESRGDKGLRAVDVDLA